MRSIFELISTYKSSLIVIPIIAIASLIVNLFIGRFLNKNKKNKYYLNIAVIIIGSVGLLVGYKLILSPKGLFLIDKSILLYVFGFVGLFFSLIIDIFDDLSKENSNKKKLDKKDKRKLVAEVKK